MTNATGVQKYPQIKRRIKKVQGKASATGFFYLLATLAVTALACLELITFQGGAIGVLQFWKPFAKFFEGGDFLAVLKANFLELVIAAVYSLMLIDLLINVLRSFYKLGWLFKKNASKLYGFNRNMYAMDDLGKIFSNSFASVVCAHFVIVLLVEGVQVDWLFAAILLGVGGFFHFVCGIASGNVSVFSTDDKITEEKRKGGCVSPVVRNVIQLAATAGAGYFFLKASIIRATLLDVFAITDPMEFILPGIHLLILLWIVCLAYYALGTKEFDPECPKVKGRKAFLFVSLLLALTAAGAIAYGKIFKELPISYDLLAVAGIALAAFILEIVLAKFPKSKDNDPDEVDMDAYIAKDRTETWDAQGMPRVLPPVYLSYGAPVQGKNNRK